MTFQRYEDDEKIIKFIDNQKKKKKDSIQQEAADSPTEFNECAAAHGQ